MWRGRSITLDLRRQRFHHSSLFSHPPCSRKMDTRLLEILIKGDVRAFCRLLDQDPLLLDSLTVPTADSTPLHVASLLGHEELAGEILRRRSELAKYRDGRGLYPLHIAAAKGHFEIAKKILETDPSLSFCRDKDGQTPLHLAAANGHAALLVVLLPRSKSFTDMVTETGKTVLHLSVKFNQVEVVRFLVEGHKELINLKDESGITALHLASARRNGQIVKLLLQENSIEVNALNENGCTALDILLQCPIDVSDMEICDLLLRFGGKKGSQCTPTMKLQQEKDKHRFFMPKKISWTRNSFQSTVKRMWYKKDENWLKDMQNAIMIVSTVIAGATFQTGLNPPGNQDDELFNYFLIFDTIALGLSMSIILFLVSGLSLKNRFMTWILTIMLWASVSTMAIAFLMGAKSLSRGRNSLMHLLSLVLFCWLLMILFLASYHFVLLLIYFLRFFLNSCCSCFRAECEP